MARARGRQKEIAFPTHGGKRRGAGRKPEGERARVSHAARAPLTGREPVLVTLKMGKHVWNLRTRRALERIVPALVAVIERSRTRLVHISLQRDHIHMIVEAASATELSRAVQGLCVRIARALNRMMKRTGKVFADRFHDRVLATPRQVRNALRYVLLNARKHGEAPGERGWLDPYSSARSFDGWARDVATSDERHAEPPTVAPQTWLLRVGWRRAGALLDPGERPGPALRSSRA